MNILKKKLNYEDGIYKYEVTDLIAKIINFYDQHPFPNYKKTKYYRFNLQYKK